jgi:hypothetical protein
MDATSAYAAENELAEAPLMPVVNKSIGKTKQKAAEYTELHETGKHCMGAWLY